MVFNPFLKQFMYGIHTPDPEIPIVINNLENPIYKEEEKNKLHVRINLPNIDKSDSTCREYAPNRIDQKTKKKKNSLCFEDRFYTF